MTIINMIYGWSTEEEQRATQWPSPKGFHVPLSTDRQAAYSAFTWLWLSWWDNFRNYLKMPYAWCLNQDNSSPSSRWDIGFYWASNYYRDSRFAYQMYLRSSSINPTQADYRCGCYSLRCFKNYPVIPTSSWSKLYWTSIAAGWIFWSSTDWLISLSSNWTDWVTIMDKNLWATNVYNTWNTLSEANCGKYYQWWNCYWFAFAWNVTRTSTQVNASTYWPWNYYSAPMFITWYTWDSSDNRNLRWWVDGNVPVS